MLCCPASPIVYQLTSITFNVEDVEYGGCRVSFISTGQCERSAAYLVKRLQSRLKALARLINGLEDSTMFPTLSCHCMGLNPRVHLIQSKLVVLVHRVLHGNAPEYLGVLAHSESIITAINIIQLFAHPASSSLDDWCKGVYSVGPSQITPLAVSETED